MGSKRYDELVLNALLDRYERSVLYDGKNQIRVDVSFPIREKSLPEYFDETSTKYDVIHEQLETLEAKGYIRLVWRGKKNGHILDKCTLNEAKVNEVYFLLHRKPRKIKELRILTICDQYLTGDSDVRDAVLRSFLFWIKEQLETGNSIKKYVDIDEPEMLEKLCLLLTRILRNKEEIYLRRFSLRVFQDSKVAEQMMTRACAIIRHFTENSSIKDLTSEENDVLLEEFNIYRNPSWIMMKGAAGLTMGGSRIALADIPEGIGIANTSLGEICWDREAGPEVILTIENLTSFHQWKSDFTKTKTVLCIYLGGYANHVKRAFLKELSDTFPEALFYHFGDIDCGGFMIWKTLCEGTGIPFRLFHMGMAEYEKYLPYGKALTERDRKRLEAMRQDPFFARQQELFERMLREGKKLEQECMD